jgi:hypothetical protein
MYRWIAVDVYEGGGAEDDWFSCSIVLRNVMTGPGYLRVHRHGVLLLSGLFHTCLAGIA